MAGAAATLGVAGSYYSYGVSYFFKKDDIWYKAIGPAAEAMGIMGICLHLRFGRKVKGGSAKERHYRKTSQYSKFEFSRELL